ncbi:hypothetical protein M409DRAFT_31171 [Zasmidium cellare ATCC 36951]|uniref:Uncharacterized protein n=1 Tax=Zasmidium cellare ATCC 36951 TaxID=1080233 RepID=A0A6A6BXL6_ZASCE|nr:uncharacterized protein M409DRAFT_31171 [Zasmidium cellare ATCC 36951]KAF2158302.1 hypothetical protein M409DRAFT_31171 [Zasmidium cellare ATCC 36951]
MAEVEIRMELDKTPRNEFMLDASIFPLAFLPTYLKHLRARQCTWLPKNVTGYREPFYPLDRVGCIRYDVAVGDLKLDSTQPAFQRCLDTVQAAIRELDTYPNRIRALAYGYDGTPSSSLARLDLIGEPAVVDKPLMSTAEWVEGAIARIAWSFYRSFHLFSVRGRQAFDIDSSGTEWMWEVVHALQLLVRSVRLCAPDLLKTALGARVYGHTASMIFTVMSLSRSHTSSAWSRLPLSLQSCHHHVCACALEGEFAIGYPRPANAIFAEIEVRPPPGVGVHVWLCIMHFVSLNHYLLPDIDCADDVDTCLQMLGKVQRARRAAFLPDDAYLDHDIAVLTALYNEWSAWETLSENEGEDEEEGEEFVPALLRDIEEEFQGDVFTIVESRLSSEPRNDRFPVRIVRGVGDTATVDAIGVLEGRSFVEDDFGL